MSRDNIVQARLNEREDMYLEELAEQLCVSKSEAIRVVLYDSRFLYSSGVDFGNVDVEPDKLIEESSSPTTGEASIRRIFD